ARAPERSWDLSSVRTFLNAGEQVTPAVVGEFLRAVAPFGVSSRALQSAFGMAESCTCVTYRNGFDPETGIHRMGTTSFVDLGPPIPGVQLRVTDPTGRPLPEGKIGRVQIRGPVVTPGYL